MHGRSRGGGIAALQGRLVTEGRDADYGLVEAVLLARGWSLQIVWKGLPFMILIFAKSY